MLFSAFAIFAMNVKSETKVQCFYEAFDYYAQLLLVIALPYLFTLIVFIGSIAYAHYREKVIFTRKPHARKKHYEGGTEHGSIAVAGMWVSAPIILQGIDFFFPFITRTLPVKILRNTVL